MLRKLLKFLGGLALFFLLYIVGFLILGTLTDWQPQGTESLRESNGQTAAETVINDSIVSFMTWNVGYGGIGDKDFFFYNQAAGFWWTKPGTVRMSEERVKSNVVGQEVTLKGNAADIYLLQEVDTAARRSHYINQLAVARDARSDYAAHYASNFKSKRVPLPFFQPWDHYGYVVGGLVSLSRYQPISAERIQLPGEYAWPTKLFQLDRCALRQVIPVKGGKELAVYNIHFSAYDADGSIRAQQMGKIKELALDDYAAGRYVVVGADWNQVPPGFNWFSMNPTVKTAQLPLSVDFEFMPDGWGYAYDPTVATNRESAAPYALHKTRRTVIDFFLLSPNLRIKTVRGIEQAFRYSDHQPVYMEVELL
ncbi:endonuclease/exonuclease/phosphatase family protein [Neolewinella aurantiaca]|uniref:Endonuclease/exonuclease/phosphatase family protein n=1 Tax=Neolewinella aurantiaca TaxID=2602767 RepID=A0A5C7FX61_9BACT|nr:endonuclease/exonuclease/phosphatase family protein [Neolewinella aurantiaca]TXF91030.1 endonuclease/exonuclease/phosphatase family protein [Neolewinella aurantiaca]